MLPRGSTFVVYPKANSPTLWPGQGAKPQRPRAPTATPLALSMIQVLSLLRLTSMTYLWGIGLPLARLSRLGQKSISQARVPALRIAFRLAVDAPGKLLM